MKRTAKSLDEMSDLIPDSLQKETELSFQISSRIYELMQERGLSKKQFADALDKRPCEVTKWLSSQHNFTIATLGVLLEFWGQPIIMVG